MDRENEGGAERSRSKGRPKAIAGDRRGWGGFYESIMAMMIVTTGIVLLTASFTFLAARGEGESSGMTECREIISEVLGNRTIAPSDRMLNLRQMDKVDWASMKGGADIGMSVFLTLPDGTTRTLYLEEMPDRGERFSISEPVNITERGGKVSAGLLTVRVWYL